MKKLTLGCKRCGGRGFFEVSDDPDDFTTSPCDCESYDPFDSRICEAIDIVRNIPEVKDE